MKLKFYLKNQTKKKHEVYQKAIWSSLMVSGNLELHLCLNLIKLVMLVTATHRQLRICSPSTPDLSASPSQTTKKKWRTLIEETSMTMTLNPCDQENGWTTRWSMSTLHICSSCIKTTFSSITCMPSTPTSTPNISNSTPPTSSNSRNNCSETSSHSSRKRKSTWSPWTRT